MSLLDFLKPKQLREGYGKTVFISGTGRSGTTWLAQLINFRNDYRVLFEPFHNAYVPAWSGYCSRHYLRGDEKDRALKNAVDYIIKGKVSGTWVDKRLTPPVKKKLLIKDIRTNLMLKWIKKHYPKIPIVLIIRHPGAVAQSKIKLNWGHGLEGLTAQEKLMNDYLKPFSDLLNHPPSSAFQSHILFWCAENYVPLNQLENNESLVIFYENLLLDPEKQLKILFDYIGEPWDPRVLEKVKKPSFMAKDHSAILHEGADMLSGWRDGVSQSDLDAMEKTLTLFGFEKLYPGGDVPDAEALKNIRRIE